MSFSNIHFFINCNNPVRIFYVQRILQQPVCFTWRSDLTINKSVWDYMKKQKKKLRQTKARRTMTTSPRWQIREETYLQNYSTVKSLRHLCKNAVKWRCFQK